MSDIYRFNNKYLKCIVTKYSSTFNNAGYLANSGALIVYHPEHESELYKTTNIDGTESEESYDRNYIYLGNEFLASGYGFLCKDMRIKAENIIEKYDETINALKKSDETEQNDRKEQIQNIWDTINKYVIIDGGDISKTTVNVNGSLVNTKDILLYGEEAKYKNLEITNISVKINGESVKNNDINLPIGTRIKTIDIDIEYDINDSGGIDKIEVIHKNLNYEGQIIQDTLLNKPYLDANNNWWIGNTNLHISGDSGPDDSTTYVPYINEEGFWCIGETNTNIKAINIESVILNYDLDDSSRVEQGIVHYKKIFGEDASLYVTDKIDEIISGFYIYVKKTPVSKYKNYPMLENNLGIKLKSIGNIIQDNKIEILKNINIIPYYSLFYKAMQNSNDSASTSDFINANALILNTESNTRVIIKNSGYENYKVLYFALPIQYKIDNIYGVNNNYEYYNWTGAVLMNSRAYNLLTYDNYEGSYYTAQYNIYKISDYDNVDANKGFSCNQIAIDVSLKTENLTYSVEFKETIEDNPIIFDDLSKNINNEYFNSLYWIDLKNYNNENTINDKLDSVIYNCS